MIELVVVFGTLAALGVAVALSVAATEMVFFIGIGFIVAGMLLGLPASFVYHQQLRRALSSRGALPRRWWLNPVPYHERLAKADRRRVVGWLRAGVAFAVMALAGCAMVLSSVWRWR